MKLGTYDHVSSRVAELFGLTWSYQKVALKQLGPQDHICNLIFVSVSTDLINGEYIYLINRVEIRRMEDGMRFKKPAFHFNNLMVNYLNRVSHQLWYITVGDALVRVQEKDFSKLSTYLNIQVNADPTQWFDQDMVSGVTVKQPYIPQRGKRKKEVWT